MSVMQIRSGIPQFDAVWDRTVPTEPTFTSPIWLIRVERYQTFGNNSHLLYLSKTARNALDGLFARDRDEFAWVYVVRHSRPRTGEPIFHGEIVCDSQRFPIWTLQANRRKESEKILLAVRHVIDSVAWSELDEVLVKDLRGEFHWEGLVTDVENNPTFDKYDGDGIVGRAFVCSFGLLRDLLHDHTYRRLAWAEEDKEDYGETAQYIDEAIEEAFQTVAEQHGLWVSVEDSDVFVGKTLLEEKDDVRIKNSKIFEWEEYPDGYGHAMASEPEIAEFTFEPGSMATVTKIIDVDDIQIELYHDEHGTFSTDVEFDELEPLTNH